MSKKIISAKAIKAYEDRKVKIAAATARREEAQRARRRREQMTDEEKDALVPRSHIPVPRRGMINNPPDKSKRKRRGSPTIKEQNEEFMQMHVNSPKEKASREVDQRETRRRRRAKEKKARAEVSRKKPATRVPN